MQHKICCLQPLLSVHTVQSHIHIVVQQPPPSHCYLVKLKLYTHYTITPILPSPQPQQPLVYFLIFMILTLSPSYKWTHTVFAFLWQLMSFEDISPQGFSMLYHGPGFLCFLRLNQFILKEISPGCSLEGMMLKLKLQYFGHLMRGVDSLEKTLMLGGIGGRRTRGQQRMRWLDGITDLMDMSVNSGSW